LISGFRYFAYGSNMAIQRLQRRTPSASLLEVACLREHELRWHKPGRDGSGKCDAFFTGDPSHTVWGAVYAISNHERPMLDRVEHIGIGYESRTVTVHGRSGSIDVMAYCALQFETGLRPFDWYKNYVVQGARQLILPPEYITAIERVEAMADPDPDRSRLHLGTHSRVASS
jgi:hypothetical protein